MLLQWMASMLLNALNTIIGLRDGANARLASYGEWLDTKYLSCLNACHQKVLRTHIACPL